MCVCACLLSCTVLYTQSRIITRRRHTKTRLRAIPTPRRARVRTHSCGIVKLTRRISRRRRRRNNTTTPRPQQNRITRSRDGNGPAAAAAAVQEMCVRWRRRVARPSLRKLLPAPSSLTLPLLFNPTPTLKPPPPPLPCWTRGCMRAKSHATTIIQ